MCLSVLDRQLHALLNVTIRVDQLNIQDLAYTGQAVVVSPCNIGLEPYLLILEISSVVKVQVDLLLREHLVELVDGIRKRCYAVVGCQAHERVGKHKKKKYKRLLHILPLFRVHKCFYLKRAAGFHPLFSRHGNDRAISSLLIWLIENVGQSPLQQI